ncbi:MAG: hypothetical protein ACYDEU_08015 [Vulcanimicrobiaceae bacterium]
MNTDLFAAADWLKAENNHGYGTLPIPSQRDAEISSLLRAWLNLDESSRNAALSQIPEEHRFTLLGYSERMASLAVRDREKEYIVLGLLALGLDGWRGDWRDNATLVCLHYDAAQRIGLAPSSVFDEAAKLLPQKPAQALKSFLRRSAEDKSLATMGYLAGADDGFRYKRTW